MPAMGGPVISMLTRLSNGEHLVRSTGFTPQLTEEITSFQPEVIVADLSGEHAPSDLLWRSVKALPEPRPAVVFSTDANYWGAVHVSHNGHYAMKSPLPDALSKIVDNVLYGQGLENSPKVSSNPGSFPHGAYRVADIPS